MGNPKYIAKIDVIVEGYRELRSVQADTKWSQDKITLPHSLQNKVPLGAFQRGT